MKIVISFTADSLISKEEEKKEVEEELEEVDIKALLDQKKVEKLSLNEVLKHQHRITLPVSIKTVSYTHLTLPTIYSV